jgi:putative peptide zinc metalloprotease protein
MSMSSSSSEVQSRVIVHPFVRQEDGPETIIGQPGRGVFLAIPSEAVEVLDWLASGETIATAQDRYREKHGEAVDLEDFLIDLEKRGFLRILAAGQEIGEVALEEDASRGDASGTRYHFAWIPQRFASLVFNRFTVAISLAMIGLGLAVAVTHPRLLPGWRTLAFEEGILPVALALLGIDLLGTFIHEMAHLVAARAQGIGARLGIGNRLWILVAETDLTDIWQLPPRDRYLPFLAGPLVDALTASLLVLLLFFAESGTALSGTVVRVIQSVLLVYFLKLIWQCYFFLRTDYYYVLANLLRCKNLMGDTETFLKNRVKKLLGRRDQVDQSHIPVRERRVIRVYSVIWVAGRLAALYVLAAISLPLVLHYVTLVLTRLQEGLGVSPYHFFESLVISAVSVFLFVVGCWLWVRNSLLKR